MSESESPIDLKEFTRIYTQRIPTVFVIIIKKVKKVGGS